MTTTRTIAMTRTMAMARRTAGRAWLRGMGPHLEPGEPVGEGPVHRGDELLRDLVGADDGALRLAVGAHVRVGAREPAVVEVRHGVPGAARLACRGGGRKRRAARRRRGRAGRGIGVCRTIP